MDRTRCCHTYQKRVFIEAPEAAAFGETTWTADGAEGTIKN